MADSCRQAVRIIRAEGPRMFLRFLGSRILSTFRLWRHIRRLPATADLEDLVSLMVDRPYGRGQVVYSIQHRQEITGLLSRVAEQRPQVVVEIGTASGGTLFLLSRVSAPQALLVSIDLPGGAFGGGYHAWRAPLYRSFATGGQRIVLLRGSSHSQRMLERLRKTLADRPIDVLFIDGDHRYEGVKADFEMYSPLVRPGGLIAFHDIMPDPQHPEVGVERFWREISARLPSSEVIANPAQEGYGIGILSLSSAPR